MERQLTRTFDTFFYHSYQFYLGYSITFPIREGGIVETSGISGKGGKNHSQSNLQVMASRVRKERTNLEGSSDTEAQLCHLFLPPPDAFNYLNTGIYKHLNTRMIKK